MDYLSGYVDYNAVGTRTLAARKIFSFLSFIDSKFILIILFTFIFSFILFSLLNKFIDDKNSLYWYLSLIAPGILIYSNTPTKETLFFYPSILFIILECENIIKNKDESKTYRLIKNISKYLILIFMIRIRGTLGTIYFLFSL